MLKKLLRTVIFLSFILAVFSASALAAPEEYSMIPYTVGSIFGDGVNFRSEPSLEAPVIAALYEGDSLLIVGDADGQFVKVNLNGTEGYISKDYVLPLDTGKLLIGGQVLGNDVRLRAEPNLTSTVLSFRDKGDIVRIVGIMGDWYKVRMGDSTFAYIRGDYVEICKFDETKTVMASSGNAAKIVDVGLSMKGVNYVYGGTSPRGFDCSGFVYYCARQAGYSSIQRTASSQLNNNGTAVSRDSLAPGDLVFFKDSSRGGTSASHVGIYIGGGDFVHASSGRGCVTISALTDSYYARYYVGARRIF